MQLPGLLLLLLLHPQALLFSSAGPPAFDEYGFVWRDDGLDHLGLHKDLAIMNSDSSSLHTATSRQPHTAWQSGCNDEVAILPVQQ